MARLIMIKASPARIEFVGATKASTRFWSRAFLGGSIKEGLSADSGSASEFRSWLRRRGVGSNVTWC